MDLGDVPYNSLFWVSMFGLGAAVLVVFWPHRLAGACTLVFALLALMSTLWFIVRLGWGFTPQLLTAFAAAAVALGLSIAVLVSAGRSRAFVFGGLTALACVSTSGALLFLFFWPVSVD